jgi:hypothetical protein
MNICIICKYYGCCNKFCAAWIQNSDISIYNLFTIRCWTFSYIVSSTFNNFHNHFLYIFAGCPDGFHLDLLDEASIMWLVTNCFSLEGNSLIFSGKQKSRHCCTCIVTHVRSLRVSRSMSVVAFTVTHGVEGDAEDWLAARYARQLEMPFGPKALVPQKGPRLRSERLWDELGRPGHS